jgi:hypothetical protein
MNVFLLRKSIIYFVKYRITGRIPDTVQRLLRDSLCLEEFRNIKTDFRDV